MKLNKSDYITIALEYEGEGKSSKIPIDFNLLDTLFVTLVIDKKSYFALGYNKIDSSFIDSSLIKFLRRVKKCKNSKKS